MVKFQFLDSWVQYPHRLVRSIHTIDTIQHPCLGDFGCGSNFGTIPCDCIILCIWATQQRSIMIINYCNVGPGHGRSNAFAACGALLGEPRLGNDIMWLGCQPLQVREIHVRDGDWVLGWSLRILLSDTRLIGFHIPQISSVTNDWCQVWL
jgi:hypothetical protein